MHSQRVESVSNLRFMLRALRYRNYRLFFAGQIVSLVGTWLSMIASSWLVYRLAAAEGRPAALLLGVVAFAGQFPVFLLTPVTGVWIDRWSRHRILMATQSLSMLQSFVLAALTLCGLITIWQVVVLYVVQGIDQCLDVPARQAFAVEMIEDRGRPEQRHRAQFVDRACRPAGRSGRGRLLDLSRRRGLLLPDRRR